MTTAPHKAILAISQHLRTVTAELANLNASLLPAYSGPLTTRPPARPVAHKPAPKPVAKRPAAQTRQKVATHVARGIDKAVGMPGYLTEQDQADIIVMLTKTQVPVTRIAKLFGVQRPSIYNLRDKHGLKVHRGSAQLMAGIARYKAKSHRKAPAKVTSAQHAPVPAATPAPTPVLPVVTSEDAAPAGVHEPALAQA